MSLPSRLTLIYAILLFSAPVTAFAGAICDNLAQQEVNEEVLEELGCEPGTTTPTAAPKYPSQVDPDDIKFTVSPVINKPEDYFSVSGSKHAVSVSAPKLLADAEAVTYEEEMGGKGDGGTWDDSGDSGGGASAVVD